MIFTSKTQESVLDHNTHKGHSLTNIGFRCLAFKIDFGYPELAFYKFDTN